MAGRSHPPTLLKLAERTWRQEQLGGPGELVLVGVSGGPDSMALADVLWKLRERLGIRVSAVGVDHGLRQEAPKELELAAGHLGSLGMAFRVERVQVAAGSNLMARARDARLAVLRRCAEQQGAARIALGHHADDRAETVLMRLMQGAGPAGLAVMPARAGDLVRPLIRARRADILLHAERHVVPFATDPTNADRRHLRAAVRHDVLPMLERLSPRLVEHLCELAEDLGALGLVSTSRVLKRPHLKAFASAAAGQGTIRVALPGGKTARFDPADGAIVVESGPEPPKRVGRRNPQK
jgi:tRNA(Ile)-lysidine synthase